MIVGAYLLQLYCDNGAAEIVYEGRASPGQHKNGEFPHSFHDELGSVCRAEARKKGWLLKHDGRAVCPRCVRAGVKL